MPKFDYRLYDVTVTTLSPLHIGNGRELLHQYDYAIGGGRTWRINEAALLDQKVDDPKLAARLAEVAPAELLYPADFRDDSPFFRYIIQGTPRSNAPGAQVREQIKDAYDRPYLPGSSLKGALRTALGWYIWGMQKLAPPTEDLGNTPKTAAKKFEKSIYGPDPNHDFLRALHVSDSNPMSPANLALENVSVLRSNGEAAAPIELETVAFGTKFSLTIKLDMALFSKWASELQFTHHGLLRNLPKVVQRRSTQQILQGKKWAAALPNGQQLVARYDTLERIAANNPDERCLIQLGWATGWGDKTFGSRLLNDPRLTPTIFDKYPLVRRGRYNPARGFPTTRRIVVDVEESRFGKKSYTPRTPLGWCLVEMKERAG